MDPENYKQLKCEAVLESMVDYMQDEDMEEGECGYTQEDIDACAAILDAYIDALAAISDTGDEGKISARVKEVVEALNRLNEETDFMLIETEQREALCELITDAAFEAGLPETDEDITEEWREW